MPELLENLSDPMEMADAIEPQVLRDLKELRSSSPPLEPLPSPPPFEGGSAELGLKPGAIEASDDASSREMNSSFPPQHLPTIGTFGGYEVVGRLALGGMAEVLLARETLSDASLRYVALKRILEPHDENESFVRMFLDEAEVVGQLEHPHIARQYDQGEVDGRHYMVLEWVNGVSLGKFIRRGREQGVVPAAAIAEVMARIADALHYAHERTSSSGVPLGIVHRDVSPHNVMISYEGDVKLIDFGIVQASTIEARQRDGVVKGKFAYMAPEQCLGLPVDRRADVFALGVCLWEAIAQRTLFLRQDALETMRAVTEEPVPGLEVRLPVGLEGLAAVASRALEKKASRRYGSAGEVRDALRLVLKEANRSVTTKSLGSLMHSLFRAECGQGPAVDTHPFGSSYHDGIPGVGGPQTGPASAPEARHEPVRELDPEATPVQGLVSGAREIPSGRMDGLNLEIQPRPIQRPSQPTRPFVTVERSGMDSGRALRVALLAIGLVGGVVACLYHLPALLRGAPSEDIRTQTPNEAPAIPPESVALPGRLSVRTDPPGLSVYFGDELLGQTPIQAAELPAGEVAVVVVHPDGTRTERVAYVPSGEMVQIFYQLPNSP